MSARALVTGGSGFAGRHLLERLVDPVAPTRQELDLLDARATRAAVREAAPEVVFHLAAIASVGRSWHAPAETLTANLAITANLLEAVRLEAPASTLVLISSGEIYGPPEYLPVDESAPRAANRYAVSRRPATAAGSADAQWYARNPDASLQPGGRVRATTTCRHTQRQVAMRRRRRLGCRCAPATSTRARLHGRA